MTSDIQIFNKDKVKIDFLKDIIEGTVEMKVQLNNSKAQDYASEIHEAGKRVYVLGKFNFSEDALQGESLIIRPIMIEGPLKLDLRVKAQGKPKKVSIIRSSTKMVESEFEVSDITSSIELIPQGKQSYLLRVTDIGNAARSSEQPAPMQNVRENESEIERGKNQARIAPEPHPHADMVPVGNDVPDNRFESFSFDEDPFSDFTPLVVPQSEPVHFVESASEQLIGNPNVVPVEQPSAELQQLEQRISVVEQHREQLDTKRRSALDHLEHLEAEYQKDYLSFEQELEDAKLRLSLDESIVQYYQDKDIVPVEDILREIKQKLEEAEAQIRVFVEAKQKRTMEIENKVKSNRIS